MRVKLLHCIARVLRVLIHIDGLPYGSKLMESGASANRQHQGAGSMSPNSSW